MKKLFGILTVLVALSSCEVDEPEIPNEEELITTLKYTLTPDDGSSAVELVFKDLDGDGGDSPVITSGTLKSNMIYLGEITLLNESESPAENITEEVEEEDAEHQFFFDYSGDIVINYNDLDASGFPVGLKSQLTTGGPSNANITITLRHEPNKSASGVSDGNIANAGGETDIAVSFAVNVE